MSENPSPAPNQPAPLDYTPSPGGYSGPAPSKDETNMATLMYILSIPTGFIGPLIIWLLKKDQSEFIDDQGKEILNWIITVAIAWVCALILVFVLIGFILMPIIGLCHLIFTIIGAVKASKGVAYRYPFAIRMLK